jgi:glycerophosphoryl diester phosphodiesterase
MFNLQGHRGARGLKPENTFPAFEAALDIGVTSIETDLHLTRDGHVVVFHDARLSDRICRPVHEDRAAAPVAEPCAISCLTLAQLRSCRADGNPDPARFPTQDAAVTPLAAAVADERGIDPFTPPTLEELLAFVSHYAGERGRAAGKTDRQRRRAEQLIFDLELKRVPFRPGRMGDVFDGQCPGLLELQLLNIIRHHCVVDRVVVRSFDHRCVQVLKRLEPGLSTAVLVAGTAPVAPPELVQRAGASIYCPEVEFLDERQVCQLHDAGITVLPWTVNDPDDWQRLLAWGVDGITTDFPDRLAQFLTQAGVPF